MTEQANQLGIMFFPWLRLDKTISVGDVSFLPFKDRVGNINPNLDELTQPLATILSSYTDITGNPINNCVVACMSNKTPIWNLLREDWGKVEFAKSLLMLSAFSKIDFFFGIGNYVNSTAFYFVGQYFTGSLDYVRLTNRRRDGARIDLGYKHGQLKFSIPLECSPGRYVGFDDTFLASLLRAHAAGSPLLTRLKSPLLFVQLASTDSATMSEEAEVILMGSAFEQLLEAESAWDMCKKGADVMKAFGTVNVESAKQWRPGIVLESEYENSQKAWPVHQKWLQEFHKLRSFHVHGEVLCNRTWGWDPSEHLVMAAFVFPLLVKLLLAKEGFYTLTESDRGHCFAVDKLLAATGWHQRSEENPNSTVWQDILSKGKSEVISRKCRELWNELIKDGT